jgi:hypothetical protein
MDFIFATFPWLITRKLEMRRAEKIGLCVTMSLGMMYAQTYLHKPMILKLTEI